MSSTGRVHSLGYGFILRVLAKAIYTFTPCCDGLAMLDHPEGGSSEEKGSRYL